MSELLDVQTFAAVGALDGDGFVGMGDSVGGGPIFVQSGDGLDWTELSGTRSGLPAATAGPYRLWQFGDGYLMYGSSGFGDEQLLGEDPMVAISADLKSWEIVDLPGIDQFFYQGRASFPEPGGVSPDGTLAVISGFNRLFESGVAGRVVYALRPGEETVKVSNDEGVARVVAVGAEIVGVVPGRGGYGLARLDDSSWQSLPSPPTNPNLGPDLRAVGEQLILMNAAEYWLSTDVGLTWEQLSPVSSQVRSFGRFSQFGAAGPAEPAFGTPESFEITADGRTWRTVALPLDAVGIRHVATVPGGVLSIVQFKGVDRYELLFTAFE